MRVQRGTGAVGVGFSGVGCRVFLGGTPVFYRCARSIENFCRIKMVVARASGMDLASSLRQNTFLTLEVRPAGGPGSARDGGTRRAPGRWDRGGSGTGGLGGPWDGGTREGQFKSTFPCGGTSLADPEGVKAI